MVAKKQTTDTEDERMLKSNIAEAAISKGASCQSTSFAAMSVWCLCSIRQQNYANFSDDRIQIQKDNLKGFNVLNKNPLSLSLALSLSLSRSL